MQTTKKTATAPNTIELIGSVAVIAEKAGEVEDRLTSLVRRWGDRCPVEVWRARQEATSAVDDAYQKLHALTQALIGVESGEDMGEVIDEAEACRRWEAEHA